jgi:hypothetical protein
MHTRHGFLRRQDQAILLAPGESGFAACIYPEGGEPTTPDSLIAAALNAHLTHLWILADYGHELTTGQIEIYARELAGRFSFESHQPHGKDYISTIVGRRLEPYSDEVTIIYLSQALWGFPGDPDALLKAFTEIEERLHIPMHPHPGVMGMNYLRKVDERNYYKYFALPKDISWPMIKSVSVSAISHMPPVTGDALNKKLLICFDRNSSQPYAASQLKTGIGQPVARQGGTFDHLMPGFWACDIEGIEDLWDGLPLIPTHHDWLPTPILKMAESKGCKIRVHECYIWPDKKDRAPVFHRWAHQLWELRQTYAPGTAERQAIKAMMNSTIGLLRRKNGEGHRDYRPDWYSLILAEERAVVWWRAHHVYEATGIRPVGGYHDSLYYCVDDESELAILTTHKNGQSLKDSLGGYKIDWILPMEPEVVAILAAEKPRNASDRIGLLKAWGREHGYI